MTELDNLRAFLATLDERHLAYARAYSDELSLGEVPPLIGPELDAATVAEIRKRVRAEWRRRTAAIGRRRS